MHRKEMEVAQVAINERKGNGMPAHRALNVHRCLHYVNIIRVEALKKPSNYKYQQMH